MIFFTKGERSMKSKFYEKLLQLKDDNGLCVKEYCSEEENQIYTELLNQKKELPIGVYQHEELNGVKLNQFYKLTSADVSHEDLQDFCSLKQTRDIHTIKNCVLFFTVVSIFSLALTVLITICQSV